MDRYGDMKRNASGYYDETPYKALTGMYNPGEIWTHTNSGNEVLILKDHDGFCTVLRLVDEEGKAGCISIVSRALKYTHPGMVQYVFNTQLGMMVKKLPDEEFKAVQEAVARALGLPLTKKAECAVQETTKVLQETIANAATIPSWMLQQKTKTCSEAELNVITEKFKEKMPELLRIVEKFAGGLADILESGDGR